MTGSYQRYVALGSSFASGPGIAPLVDRRAARSGRNHAHLLAAGLGAELVDASVGGATTANILDTPQRQLGRTFAPQIQAVHPDTDLVTVTAGGNDLGYIGGVLTDALRNRLSENALGARLVARRSPAPAVLPTTDQIAAATDGLTRIVEAARARAPRARVVLVDYLPLFDVTAPPYEVSRLRPEQAEHHRRVAQQLTGVFTAAGARTGADVVLADAPGQGHTVGTPDPWVNGLSVRHLLGSFHPTAAGMRAVADAVGRVLVADPEDPGPGGRP